MKEREEQKLLYARIWFEFTFTYLFLSTCQKVMKFNMIDDREIYLTYLILFFLVLAMACGFISRLLKHIRFTKYGLVMIQIILVIQMNSIDAVLDHPRPRVQIINMFICTMFSILNGFVAKDVFPPKLNPPYFIITYLLWLYGFSRRLWGDTPPSFARNIMPNLRIFLVVCIFIYAHWNMQDINIQVHVEA